MERELHFTRVRFYILIHGPFYILLSGQHQNWRWHAVLSPFTGDLLPRLDKNIL